MKFAFCFSLTVNSVRFLVNLSIVPRRNWSSFFEDKFRFPEFPSSLTLHRTDSDDSPNDETRRLPLADPSHRSQCSTCSIRLESNATGTSPTCCEFDSSSLDCSTTLNGSSNWCFIFEIFLVEQIPRKEWTKVFFKEFSNQTFFFFFLDSDSSREYQLT